MDIAEKLMLEIAGRRDDLVELTQELIRIPTLNPPGGPPGCAVRARTDRPPVAGRFVSGPTFAVPLFAPGKDPRAPDAPILGAESIHNSSIRMVFHPRDDRDNRRVPRGPIPCVPQPSRSRNGGPIGIPGSRGSIIHRLWIAPQP